MSSLIISLIATYTVFFVAINAIAKRKDDSK